MKRFTRDETEHGQEYYLASDVDKVWAQPAQEPIGTLNLGAMIYTSEGLEYDDWDVELSSKTIEALQERLVTSDPVTLNIYTTPQERNFCPRCGKRTADLTVSHTCTPPQETTE